MDNKIFEVGQPIANGFTLVKCKDCGHEYLLAFSCKRRPPLLPIVPSEAGGGIRGVA